MCVQEKMHVSSVMLSDRSSDTSETSTYCSHEEDKKFDPDLVEERFRVDRKKLEQMIQGDDDKTQAEVFFKQVMEKTDTIISWPSKLKIGAKSKKDPHIKVSGKGDSVKEAKNLVMSLLDTKSNRVTLKMDVPFTDHSHIIGKGGSNIQRVMTETGCHIHFPDSNRNNPVEKSNQVSIAGQPTQVERARACIRNLLPLAFTFEVPITGDLQPFHDSTAHGIHQIEERFNVKIQFRQRLRTFIAVVIVRGSETQANNVKEATKRLIDHLGQATGVLDKVQFPVTLTIEVAPQHHGLVSGRGNVNVNLISQLTGTQIIFPDLESATFQPRKGTVTITGSVEGVYSARQKLIGCLPLVLMFDLKDDVEPDSGFVTEISERFDVFVTIKPKIRQLTKSIIIRGMERNVNDLFEARRALLSIELTEPPVPCMVPPSYSMGHSSIYRTSANFGVLSLGIVSNNSVPPPVFGNNVNVNSMYAPSGIGNGYNSIAPPLMPAQWDPPELRAYNQYVVPLVTNVRSFKTSSEKAPSVCSSTASTLSSPTPSPRQGSPVASHGTSSYSTGSVGVGVNIHVTRERTCLLVDAVDLSNSSLSRLQELLTGQPQISNNVPDNHDVKICGSRLADYEKKRLLADKVMKEKPSLTNTRVPNNYWAGCGFSKSLPEAKLNQKNKLLRTTGVDLSFNGTVAEEDENVDNVFNSGNSSRLNSNHSSEASLLGGCNDSAELGLVLKRIGFEKYSYLFQQQEIDMSTFLNLSEKDLTELGIPTMGARKKIFDAIKELNQQRFSVAPGAERKSSFASSNGSANGYTAHALSKW